MGGADPMEPWFHTGAGWVLKVWVGSIAPPTHVIDGAGYVSQYGDHLRSFMDPHRDGTLQQDNAPCLRSQVAQDWYEEYSGEFPTKGAACPFTGHDPDGGIPLSPASVQPH